MKTVKWYQFVLAALVLILGPAIIALILGPLWSLVNSILPYSYQSSFEWISLIVGIGACAGSVVGASTVLNGEKPEFILVFCSIFVFLWLWSLVLCIIDKDWWQAILDGSKFVVYLYFIIRYFKDKTSPTT